MRFFRYSLLPLGIALIAGVAYYYGAHQEIGLFVWSVKRDAESGRLRIVRPLPKSPLGDDDRLEDILERIGADGSTIDGSLPGAAPVIRDGALKSWAKSAAPKEPERVALFDGKTLGKWEPVQFGGEGEVVVTEDGAIEFGFGAIMTGIRWKENPPRVSNYEISLEAMLLGGNDFFCGLTFPLKESHASLIVGGWGGGVVGISSVDDLDASENETMNIESFEKDVWYAVKVRVTDEKLEAWIDGRRLIDLDLRDRKIGLRAGDIEQCAPLGLCSYMTRAQYRNIEWRNLPLTKEQDHGDHSYRESALASHHWRP